MVRPHLLIVPYVYSLGDEYNMKFSSISPDLIVAMYIQDDEPILYNVLRDKVKEYVNATELAKLLTSLIDWGMVGREHTSLGSMYYVTSEADPIIKSLRDRYWPKKRWWRRIFRR